MNKVDQTKTGDEGNCFAACIASILELELKDVDVDLTECKNWIDIFNRMKQTKPLMKKYDALSLRYSLLKKECDLKSDDREVVLPANCYCILNYPEPKGIKNNHAVVGCFDENGKLLIVHNPDPRSYNKIKCLENDEKNVEVIFLLKSFYE